MVILDGIQRFLEKNQNYITQFLGNIEKNNVFQGIKKTLLYLNFILLTSSFLGMLVVLNRKFISSRTLEEPLVFLMKLLLTNFSLFFVVILSLVFFKTKNNAHFVLTNISIFSILIFVSVQHGGNGVNDLLFALISTGISSIIVLFFKKIDNMMKKKIKTTMDSLTNCLLVFYYSSFFILFYLICEYVSTEVSISNVFSIINIDNPVLVFIIIFLEMLMWYIGVNGYGILAPIVLFFAINNLTTNLLAIANGNKPQFIFTPNFWDYFISVTGSGMVGSLVLLAVISKNISIKELGKKAALGTLFSVSEPIIYGLPVVMNKIFFIPFVIGPSIIGVLQWYVFKLGWVNPPTFFVADLPLPFSSLLATLDFRSILLVVGSLALSTLIYLPFFKYYEKNKVDIEKDDKYDDLDLDF